LTYDLTIVTIFYIVYLVTDKKGNRKIVGQFPVLSEVFCLLVIAMVVKLTKSDIEFMQKLPVCRLATVAEKCKPMVRPVWPVFDGKNVYIASDFGTPKLKQIEANPQVSVVFDDYDRENWTNLRGIRIQGEASVLIKGEEYGHAHTLLKDKYPEYRSKEGGWKEGEVPIIKIAPSSVAKWANGT
jgi:nitroimidazol reductase NimA-like FMN-containing flavoprotein (pyridoxamine 5'-phosphate oxidase superfamily)